jgi:hypothetical protein
MATWSTNAIKNIRNKFHQIFQVGLWAHPFGYKDLNFGWTTKAHKQAKEQAKVHMQIIMDNC